MMYHINTLDSLLLKCAYIVPVEKKRFSVLKMHISHVIIVYYIKKRRNLTVHLNQIIICAWIMPRSGYRS